MRRFDLRSLGFGDASEVGHEVAVDVAPFQFGGAEYTVADGRVMLLLSATRVGRRLTLRAELKTELLGPCQRCLEDARYALLVEGDEYVLEGESEGVTPDEEGYVTGHLLDLAVWARDLIGAELPTKILCREDCRGLCPICGQDLNADPDHVHEPDPHEADV